MEIVSYIKVKENGNINIISINPQNAIAAM